MRRLWNNSRFISCTAVVFLIAPAVQTQTQPGSVLTAPGRLSVPSTVSQTPQPQAQQMYRSSDWSQWIRGDDLDFRFRWGWFPGDPKYATQVDAIYQIRNRIDEEYGVTVHILDCKTGAIAVDKEVILKPRATRGVVALTENCSTQGDYSFRAGPVVRHSIP